MVLLGNSSSLTATLESSTDQSVLVAGHGLNLTRVTGTGAHNGKGLPDTLSVPKPLLPIKSWLKLKPNGEETYNKQLELCKRIWN